ncbi:hypothetical protein [Sinorhizobium terangae]|uniref:Uncharacterized protein n=1 Tax=Sinorhizobium terangae TaxID=110322 RepID=A0A6N7LA57_SINTE|nr:hypothetical protein [Sinorhizobium terangae]MBB4188112.1 hypothetical protein [Sinorhizobium terangae]MQX14486.1 hypothetical protein [Sinorhizobium terangae]WFU49442.1 hypothetical protein QA637_08595 [Sinorhizobium terangae]
MSALTLVTTPYDNATYMKADGQMAAATVKPETVVRLQPETTALASGDEDMVLAILSRARSFIDRIATRRRANNIARNRVETRRELARLPARVRNDLLLAEQQPAPLSDSVVA